MLTFQSRFGRAEWLKPYTQDTLDPRFVTGGRDFLLTTARRAMDELRNANVPSAAFPGELLADVIPAEVITTLAVSMIFAIMRVRRARGRTDHR